MSYVLSVDKILIVGMNPSKSRAVYNGSALSRLRKWTTELDLQFFTFINLSNDMNWDRKFDTIDKDFVCTSVEECDIIIALGTMVSAYLKRLGYKEHFVLPHPSPLNRQINDQQYIDMKLSECRRYINANSNSYSRKNGQADYVQQSA
jgi:uracil-DNA glycosylase